MLAFHLSTTVDKEPYKPFQTQWKKTVNFEQYKKGILNENTFIFEH